MNTYTLTAQNYLGASTQTYGNSIAECLRQFDARYDRGGFKITVINNKTQTTKSIKTTYR